LLSPNHNLAQAMAMFLPREMTTVLGHFQPAFSVPTFRKAVVLLAGTLLGRERRTVTTALWQVGWQDRGDWTKYPHSLNRAKWSSLQVAQILLRVLVQTFVPAGGEVALIFDETLERRWGRQITTRVGQRQKRGHW
jgi:hypothetical protein